MEFEEDTQLLDAFETCKIPLHCWCHEYHVRVAFIYLEKYGFNNALISMREGIQRYNDSKSIPNSLESGYHETLTVAWLKIIESQKRGCDSSDSLQFWCSHRQLHDKTLLRRYYTSDCILTDTAKRKYVEPDIRPLLT